jgi:hypothetical protein
MRQARSAYGSSSSPSLCPKKGIEQLLRTLLVQFCVVIDDRVKLMSVVKSP